MPISKSVLQMHWLPMKYLLANFEKWIQEKKYVIRAPSPHASPDETYMFCGPVIFSWNHRPTANNKQPKTSLQTLGWEKWQRVRSCPAIVFFGFASPSKLIQQASKPETVFLVGFARPGGFHFIPKNRARTQDSAEQSLFVLCFLPVALHLKMCFFDLLIQYVSRSNLFMAIHT